MAREYQVRIERIEDESELYSKVRCFSNIGEARQAFVETVKYLRDENPEDDIHAELVEVIEEERIEHVMEDL